MTTHERNTLTVLTAYIALALWSAAILPCGFWLESMPSSTPLWRLLVPALAAPLAAGGLLYAGRRWFLRAVARDGLALAITKAGANSAYFAGVVTLCLVLDPAGAFFSGQYGKCLAIVAAVAVLAVVVRLIYAAIARAIIRRRGGGGDSGTGGTRGPTAPPAHGLGAESDTAQERAMLTSDAEVPAFVAARTAGDETPSDRRRDPVPRPEGETSMSGAGLFQTTAGRLTIALAAMHAQSEAAVSLLTGDPPAELVRRRLRVAQAQMAHVRDECRVIATVAARARCTIPDLSADEVAELCEVAQLVCLLPDDEDRFVVASYTVPPLFLALRFGLPSSSLDLRFAVQYEDARAALFAREDAAQLAEAVGWPSDPRQFVVLPFARAAALSAAAARNKSRDPA